MPGRVPAPSDACEPLAHDTRLRSTLSGREPEFEVERFERVSAGGGNVLLRISGRWRADSRERLAPPLLLLDDGRRTRRLAALPGPDDASPLAGPDPPPWRAAFSAPATALTDGHLAFALETSRGIVDLPRPKEAAARTSKAPPVSPAPAPATAPPRAQPSQPVEPEGLREERRRRETAARAAEQRRQAMAALEQRLEAERRLRGSAEQAAREARDELTALRAQTRDALRDGDRETQALAERVAFHEQARATAEEQARAARDEIAAARAELDRRNAAEREARTQLEAAVAERERELAAARAEAERVRREGKRALDDLRTEAQGRAARTEAELRAAREHAAQAKVQSEAARTEGQELSLIHI